MAEKDVAEKKLLDYADVFADIVNVALFDGQRIIAESDLADALPRSVYKLDGKMHEQERDVAKFWKKNQLRISLIGLENQSEAEADMPIRVIGYDGAAYRSELNADEKGKPKVRYPIVTLVLYFGYQTHWNKERRLKECFDIPEPLEPYVNDYPLHVVEVAWLPDEIIAKFQSDFKLVADYFSQMRKDETYDPMPDEIQHVRETLELLSALSGDNRFWESGKDVKEGEKFTMRSVALDKIEARGRKEGITAATMKIVRKMLTMKMPYDSIAESTEMPIEEVVRIAKESGLAY
ncbi:MAG: Rpn family recombination-promoting nuclease/putative transposase [Selenomonadaceae bacterium]|nr:Rpn family recombination-promoting nuclease/putative transposase [Selenomonadaceae bacterium]